MNKENASLQIPKDIIIPLIDAKIKESILSAMGGTEVFIEKVVNQVFTQKVNKEGRIGSYSSENKYNWVDITVTNIIKENAKIAIQELLESKQELLKEVILKQLSTKKGATMLAKSMIENVGELIKSNHKLNVDINFEQPSNNY